MCRLTVRNKTRGRLLGERIMLADTFLKRLRGVVGTRRLARGGGVLLSPCRAVHTLGCMQSLDVVFIDRRGSVVALYPNLRPMRVTRWVGEAEYALELPPGTISSTGTQVRDRLAWVPSPAPCVDEDKPLSTLGSMPSPRRRTPPSDRFSSGGTWT
jgi:hypothetical protein